MRRKNQKLSSYVRQAMMSAIAKTAVENKKFRERVQKMGEENQKLSERKQEIAERLAKMPKAEKAKRMYLIKKNRRLRAEKDAKNVDFYKNNFGIVLSREVSNNIVKIIRTAYNAEKTANFAVKEAINFIKSTDEYKSLSEKQKLEINVDLVIDIVTYNLCNNEKDNKQIL